tara:strand:+ start:29 stop:1060 length:1032 start_codon:yes stop_codon:yes gene_type:complete
VNNNVEFDVAEVLGYDNTYTWVPFSESNEAFNNNNLFALKVRSCSGYVDRKTFIARPANNNIKKIPLIGEIVLLFKSFNQYASNSKTREIWYYLDTINIQSSINENRLPGLSLSKNLKINVSERKPAGFTFDETKKISPLQPYEGDMLFEGRFGNSIRFGSTISTVPQDKVHKSPSWTGDVNGDPIIILSNGQNNLEDKEFVVEDIEQDKSSLYLTSTQNINNIVFSTDTPPKDYNDFEGSNFVGIADRLILRSKKDQTIIDSQGDITLNTPNKVMIGSDSTRMTGIPQGEQLLNVLRDIAAILKSGHIVEGSISRAVKKDKLKTLSANIEKILSTKYSIEKN